MCTIYTYTPELRDAALAEARRTRSSNSDGASLLLVSKGRVILSVSGTWDTCVLAIARSIEPDRYDRAFIHLRASTGGAVTTANCHGWGDRATGEVYVQHNGYLSGARDTAVDSQAILEWIELGGVPEALAQLRVEDFANVFLIDEATGCYTVHRSLVGSLYGDGRGNFGTTAYGPVTKPVQQFSQEEWCLITGECTWDYTWDAAETWGATPPQRDWLFPPDGSAVDDDYDRDRSAADEYDPELDGFGPRTLYPKVG